MLKRGIIHGGNILNCVLRSSFEETSLYLFLFYVFAMNVWKGVKRWLDMEMVITSNCILSYISFGRWMRKEIENALGNIIWGTTMWFFWIGRNNIIFRGKPFIIEDTINSIKFHSWRWLCLESSSTYSCIFYDWYISPINCLKRV